MQPNPRTLLGWMLVLLALTSAAANQVFVGQLQETAIHKKEGGSANASQQHEHDDHGHVIRYHLKLRSGELRLLDFPKPPAHLPRSGTWLMVRTLPKENCGIKDGTNNAMCVGSMVAKEDAMKDVFAPGQPRGVVQMKALVMQLQVCGQGPATSPTNLAGALFDHEPNSQPETVEGMFRSCSYGSAEWSKSLGSQIVEVQIPIPCSGKTPWGAPYDSSTCPFTEWSDVANDYMKHVLGYNWEDFKYKVYVVPPGDLCSWGGMGWVGCTSDCRAWISGDLWKYPTTWMHELGHNLYLNHAGSFQATGNELQYIAYKDDSGAMGHCCSTRCFNAPHSFQLGWSKPVDVIQKDMFPEGKWRSYILPPRSGPKAKDINMLRVHPDWDGPAAAYNLYIEYRKAEGYDTGLYTTVSNKVTVYSTPLGDAMPYTTFEAAVGENQIMHESRIGSNLAVWVGSMTEEGIKVNLCRPSSAEEVCGNGKDDDCDGFIDEEDTDCSLVQTGRKLKSLGF